MEKVTIYDIAKRADVSPSTVSRVVNGTANVRQETKQRVLAVMNESRFVPDETARGLAMQTSKLIGILISDIRTTHHTEGVYYIERELSKLGYSCLIYNTGTGEEEQSNAIRRIGQRHVDAAILMGSIYQNDAVLKAIRSYLPHQPVIICNGYLQGENIYGLVSDEKEGVYRCVRLLKERGRHHPAFLVNRYTPSNLDKETGYREGMAAFYPGESALTVLTGESDDDIYEHTLELLKRKPRVDAIIYADDMMALVGLHAISEHGYTVPDQVSVIGINNSRLARISVPPLTSLDNMLYDLSMTACRNLCALLQGERVSRKMMLYSEIVERASA